MPKIDTMIIVAHDDDEALMCGGYIAKYRGKKNILVVRCVWVTNEQYHAAVSNSEKYGYKYLPLDFVQWQVQIHELAQAISEVVAENLPHTIITHPAFDTHQEHQIVNKSVEISSRAIDMRGVGSRYVYNILYGYGTGAYENSDVWQKPNVFLKLGKDEIDAKKDMLSCYGKEMRGVRSGCHAESDSMFWGKLINCEYAEAYLAKRILLNE